jgi:hypothetical protein
MIEQNHFIIQTVRIPSSEKPSLRKIIQVALNIGQYEGTTSKILKKSNITDYISKSDSKIKLNTILSKNDIKKLYKLL